MKKSTHIKIGDSVAVKDGIKCPDMESLSIARWQGRVSDILDGEEDEVLVEIEWDSITLRSLPDDYIKNSEMEGLDWASMNLLVDEVKPVQPRDSKKDVELAFNDLSDLHKWDSFGEQGERIGNVLKDVDPDDEYDCMEAWGKYLEKGLVFPFDAEVDSSGEGPLNEGDKVRVHSIAIVDDLYGVIVDVRLGHRKYAHPLCDLEVIDKESSNYQNVQDYSDWFSNR